MDKLENRREIQTQIYRIRGQQVMLDSTLAVLYAVPTFRLNEQVRRNLRRFPADFMFRVTRHELESLRSQNAILKIEGRGRHTKYLPYLFTEQGVAMLSGILRSRRAVDVNIAIMRAFVKLRRALEQNLELSHRVEKIEGKLEMHDTDIRLLVQDMQEVKKTPDSTVDKETHIRGFSKELK